VTAHEMAHTWFQFLLASNEAKHEWMDEGFTSYISSLAENELTGGDNPNPLSGSYRGYYYLVKSGKEQPQTTHADRYNENMPYSIAAYSKGAVFLAQLGYVIGEDNLKKTLRKYFDDFSFKHPTPNDIKRTAEKVSGMELDWYLMDWAQTTNTIDYGITSVEADGNKTKVTLTRKGLMPMPIDLYVDMADGSQKSYYMPLRMMRAEKPNPTPNIAREQLADWPWTNPTYTFTIDAPLSEVKMMKIDPTSMMADIDQTDNVWEKE
jgi:aminopeptidase N